MSGWKLCLKALGDAGGGPVTEHELLLRGASLPPGRVYAAFLDLESFGFATSNRPGHGGTQSQWTITALGWEWLQGKVVRKCIRLRIASDGRPSRTKPDNVATWLRSLPPPNSIRLAGPQQPQGAQESTR